LTISKLIYMPFLTIQLLQSRLTRSSLSTDQPGNILCCFLCQKEEHSVITAFFLCLSIQRIDETFHACITACIRVNKSLAITGSRHFLLHVGRQSGDDLLIPAGIISVNACPDTGLAKHPIHYGFLLQLVCGSVSAFDFLDYKFTPLFQKFVIQLLHKYTMLRRNCQ